jgi:hypothetical protein
MHSKAQTAVDKVEAERLLNVGQGLFAASAAREARAAPMGFPRKHAQPPPTVARQQRSRNAGAISEACRK